MLSTLNRRMSPAVTAVVQPVGARSCPFVAVLIVAWPEFPASTRPAAAAQADASVGADAGRI